MQKPSEDQIRQRAHEIWERNHRPDGKDEEFWHQAERELQEEGSSGKPVNVPETPGVLPG